MITKIFRRFFVGKEQEFVFKRCEPENLSFNNMEEINFYIHIPFCKSMCPYCPYNRILYEKTMVKPYFDALSREIDFYMEKLGKIKINSIYIGGGTPTNTIDELALIIERIKDSFEVKGDIAIETTITDINDENLLKMKKMGINMLSVGIQTFNDKYLKLLGRNYNSQKIYTTFENLKDYKFDNLNIDMIFAFPEQDDKELLYDLEKVSSLKANQITLYPLFTFPYSIVGDYMKLKKIKMPDLFKRKRFYKKIYDFFIKNGYEIVSVWSFQKGCNDKKYSSVTRNGYIGLGAGAGTRLENIFYFNTFSVRNYINRLLNNILPIAIEMPITKRLSNIYWFYWKLYETRFSYKEFEENSDWRMKFLLKIFSLFDFCKIENEEVRLTLKGSFWIYLIQNYFVLEYINIVWSKMKQEAFPEKIEI